jgi:ankyrin repeat protein
MYPNGIFGAASAGDLQEIKTILAIQPAEIYLRDSLGRTVLLVASFWGHLEIVSWLLLEGGANVAERSNNGCTALLQTLVGGDECFLRRGGHLKTLKWLLAEGGSSIQEHDDRGRTALLIAANCGLELELRWLLEHGGSTIQERSKDGGSALLHAAAAEFYPGIEYLLEHGGADITEARYNGDTVWDVLGQVRSQFLFINDSDSDTDSDFFGSDSNSKRMRGMENEFTSEAVKSLLRVMVLRGAPPEELVAEMTPMNKKLVRRGARIRARLPTYLAERRALLAEHCTLIVPLRALIEAYEEPTSTEELWATGLGLKPRSSSMMQKGAKRKR